MLSCNGIVLNYAFVLYNKAVSKIDIVQDIAKELPAPPVQSYFLCDCWYVSEKIINTFAVQGFHTIGALKTNRLLDVYKRQLVIRSRFSACFWLIVFETISTLLHFSTDISDSCFASAFICDSQFSPVAADVAVPVCMVLHVFPSTDVFFCIFGSSKSHSSAALYRRSVRFSQ